MRTLHIAIVLATLIALAAVLGAACGGGDDSGDHVVLSPIKSQYLPIVVADDIGVGPSRFSLGLIDQANGDAQVLGAQLHMKFFQIEGTTGTLKFEADPTAVKIQKSYTHTHADGTVESHPAGEIGVYVANVAFDAAGTWGVEVTGTVDGKQMEAVRPTFSVLAKSQSPSIGDPAPRSVQPLLKDVTDIRQIDTSEIPIPEMHEMTIADAVTSGRPAMIVISTPAFCTSQICGPTKQIADALYPTYKDRVNFVHVEPYDVATARTGDLVIQPFLESEWHLTSEPWVFIVDKDGNIAAKFDGPMSQDEIEAAIKAVLP